MNLFYNNNNVNDDDDDDEDIKDVFQEAIDEYSDFNMKGSFAFGAEFNDKPKPRIDIEGFGRVSYPFNIAQLQYLIQLGIVKKAPFGKGSETLIDENVRKAYEIDASQVTIDPNWLNSSLSNIRNECIIGLGLDNLSGSSIECHFYKLLLYETGGHFKKHQDTEKESGHFGTLLIHLPAEHEGGDLVVEHKGELKLFSFSKDSGDKSYYSCFYADCHHTLEEVTKGIRLVLAFNLIRVGSTELTVPSSATQSSATLKVNSTFQELVDKWNNKHDFLSKMVLKLDYEYTETNLSFKGLKGKDDKVVSFLKSLSSKGSNEPLFSMALALVDRHVSGPGDDCACCGGGYNNRYNRWGYPEHDDDEDVDMLEVDDDQIYVSTWIGTSNFSKLQLELEDELIGGYDNPDDLFGSEYSKDVEGYQGNYTVNLWYNAAVLVFWPKSKDFEVLAENPGCLNYCLKIVEKENVQSQLFIDRLSTLIPIVPVASLTSSFAFINSKDHTLAYLVSLGKCGINSSDLRQFTASKIMSLDWPEIESDVTSLISILSKKTNLQGLILLMELKNLYGEKYTQVLNEYLQSLLSSTVADSNLASVIISLFKTPQEANTTRLLLELIITKITLKTEELRGICRIHIKEVGVISRDKVLGMISVGLGLTDENCMNIHLSYLHELRGNENFFDNDLEHDQFTYTCLTKAVDLIEKRMRTPKLKGSDVKDIVCVMEMLIYYYQLSEPLFEKFLTSMTNMSITDYLVIFSTDSTLTVTNTVSNTNTNTRSGFVEMQYDMVKRSRAMAVTIFKNNKSRNQLTAKAFLDTVHWILGLSSNELELSFIECFYSGISDQFFDSLISDQRALNNIKENGNFGLLVILQIRALETSLPPPLFNWKLVSATCPDNEVQSFLRGPRETLCLKRFTSIVQARAVAATLSQRTSPNNCMSTTTEGKGANAQVTIKKSKNATGYDSTVLYSSKYYEIIKKIDSLKSLLNTNTNTNTNMTEQQENEQEHPNKKHKGDVFDNLL